MFNSPHTNSLFGGGSSIQSSRTSPSIGFPFGIVNLQPHYKPITEPDYSTMISITAMYQCQNKSFEELRLEFYTQNQKPAQNIFNSSPIENSFSKSPGISPLTFGGTTQSKAASSTPTTFKQAARKFSKSKNTYERTDTDYLSAEISQLRSQLRQLQMDLVKIKRSEGDKSVLDNSKVDHENKITQSDNVTMCTSNLLEHCKSCNIAITLQSVYFQCTICENFYLCRQCEGKDEHIGHVMLRIGKNAKSENMAKLLFNLLTACEGYNIATKSTSPNVSSVDTNFKNDVFNFGLERAGQKSVAVHGEENAFQTKLFKVYSPYNSNPKGFVFHPPNPNLAKKCAFILNEPSKLAEEKMNRKDFGFTMPSKISNEDEFDATSTLNIKNAAVSKEIETTDAVKDTIVMNSSSTNNNESTENNNKIVPNAPSLDPQTIRAGLQTLKDFSEMFAKMLNFVDEQKPKSEDNILPQNKEKEFACNNAAKSISKAQESGADRENVSVVENTTTTHSVSSKETASDCQHIGNEDEGEKVNISLENSINASHFGNNENPKSNENDWQVIDDSHVKGSSITGKENENAVTAGSSTP